MKIFANTFLLLLITNTFILSQEIRTVIFPEKSIFPGLIFDSKEPQTYLTIAKPLYESILRYNTYVPFALGVKKGLIRRNNWQITLDVGAHTQFGWRKENNEFKQGVRRSDLNTDYILGLSLERKWNDKLFSRFRVFHQSTHLGDDYVLYYSIPRSGYWANDLSNYEQAEITSLYNYRFLKTYIGIGSIITPKIERKRISFQLGSYVSELSITPFKNLLAGFDIKFLQQNNYKPMLKCGAGIKINTNNPIYLMLEYYSGNLPYSRYDFEVNTRWLGISVYFQSFL